MNPFSTYPLQVAHRDALRQPRRHLDWQAFTGDKGSWRKHYLVMGSGPHGFDRCHKVSLCDFSEAPYPPTSLVRPYLSTIVWAQGGEDRKVEDQGLLVRRPPLYFPGVTSGELACVDIDAAYWSLYAPTSLDLVYDGQHTPRNGSIRFLGADELHEHKFARNALVGTLRAEYRTDLDFGTAKRIAIGGRWRRPCVWAYLMDMLEAIAWDMRLLFGAVHIHTDGYVLPHSDLAEDAVTFLAEHWGLSASVRARGEGTVKALGSWQIGETSVNGVVGEVVEGFPGAVPGAHVDSMAHPGAEPYLRAWFRECQAYRAETRYISSNRLDGLEIPW